MAKQHKKATPVNIKQRHIVMVHLPDRNNKLFSRFTGPRYVLRRRHGNKYEVYYPVLNKSEVVHSDRLKVTQASAHTSCDDRATTSIADGNENTTNTSAHSYHLRSRV